MKCNQSRPGFELVSPCPFSTTVTITPRTPLKANVRLYHLSLTGCDAMSFLSGLQLFWIQSFPSPSLVTMTRLKDSICFTFYSQFERSIHFPLVQNGTQSCPEFELISSSPFLKRSPFRYIYLHRYEYSPKLFRTLCIWSIDRILKGTTTQGQYGPKSNGNEGDNPYCHKIVLIFIVIAVVTDFYSDCGSDQL